MSIRGRRYPAITMVRPVIYNRFVPQRLIMHRVPMPRTVRLSHAAAVQITNGPPPLPVATPNVVRPVLRPTQYVANMVNQVRRPIAASQASANIFQSFQQHRPRIAALTAMQSNTTRNVMQNAAVIPASQQASNPIFHRPPVARSNMHVRTNQAVVVNPASPTVVQQRQDSQRLYRQRAQFPFPNRRQ